MRGGVGAGRRARLSLSGAAVVRSVLAAYGAAAALTFAWVLAAGVDVRACPSDTEGSPPPHGYCLIKDWQEGLGALIGLSGLAVVEIVRRVLERRDRRTAAVGAVAAELEAVGVRLDVVRRNLAPAVPTGPTDEQSLHLSLPQKAVLVREASASLAGLPTGIELLGPGACRAVMTARFSIEVLRQDLRALRDTLEGGGTPAVAPPPASDDIQAGEPAAELAHFALTDLTRLARI